MKLSQPERRYFTNFQEAVSADNSIKLRFSVINTSPMVSSYIGSAKYGYSELISTVGV